MQGEKFRGRGIRFVFRMADLQMFCARKNKKYTLICTKKTGIAVSSIRDKRLGSNTQPLLYRSTAEGSRGVL